MNKVRVFFAAAAILGIMLAWHFYPLLPNPMAVHFGPTGVADGWGDKDGFFRNMGIVYAFLIILFGALPFLLWRIPAALINLPNKDYWLAPERRENTMDGLAHQMLIMGAITLLLLDGILYLSMQANLSGKSTINPQLLWGMVAGYSAILLIWIITLLARYRLPTP